MMNYTGGAFFMMKSVVVDRNQGAKTAVKVNCNESVQTQDTK